MKIKKFTLPLPRNLLGIFVLALIFFAACKKMESISAPDIDMNKTEDKFFNTHRTSNPKEQAIINYLQRVNKKTPFVEQTAKQIGYPRWDKAIYSKHNVKNNTSSFSQFGVMEELDVFLIPFVRDSQNFVNSSLIIRAGMNDTTISYRCDWQYENKIHGSPQTDSTAENHAIFFMILDNITFGYTKFNFTDTTLFPLSVTKSGKKSLGIKNISTSSSQNSFMIYHEVCVEFYFCGNPEYCAAHGGCDSYWRRYAG